MFLFEPTFFRNSIGSAYDRRPGGQSRFIGQGGATGQGIYVGRCADQTMAVYRSVAITRVSA